MWFIDQIFSLVWDISDFFYDAWLEARDWWPPFSLLQYPLYSLSAAFWNLLDPIANLGDWLYALDGRISGFIDQSGVLSLLSSWIDQAEAAFEWVNYAAWNVWDVVSEWWTSTLLSVQGWIDSAIANVLSLVNQVSSSLATLQSTWDNFWTLTWPALVLDLGETRSDRVNFLVNILPTLASYAEVEALVSSAVRILFPFYNDLVGIWGDIDGFFSGPLDYLAARLEVWFWGDEIS